MKTLLIITDAYGQVNGVVRTLTSIAKVLEKQMNIVFLEPSMFKTIKCPSYPEIQIAQNPWRCGKYISKIKPDYIHIATEGPIGLFSKIYLDRKRIPYTTSYHTMFPEYLATRYPIPLSLAYSYFRWFHKNAKTVLTTTDSMKEILDNRGFHNVESWTRGIDRNIFKPYNEDIFVGLERPIFSYIGRVSIEKNIDDFLRLDLPGTKVVVGEGPYLEECKKKYTNVVYMGYKHGEELAKAYSSSDVFVFPSKSDTFGLVMIESLACGTPVVGYNVQGPKDVIINGYNGILVNGYNTLHRGVEDALFISRNKCVESSKKYTWEECSRIFTSKLVSSNEYNQ